VNKHQAPTQISLTTITSRPSLIRDFGSRNFTIPIVEFLGPLLPKPEMSIHRNVWPRPPPQPYRVSRFRESRNKEPLSLVFENAKMSNPDAFSKDWLPYGTFHRFRVSGLRVFMNPDARLLALQPTKPRNSQRSFDSTWRQVHHLSSPLSSISDTDSCHLSLQAFQLSGLERTSDSHSSALHFTNPDLPK
jgi:hypothetical protein